MPSWAFKVALVVMVGLGLFMIGRGVLLLHLERASRTWVATEGVVVAFDCDTDGDPLVTYRYTVQGVEYSSDRTVFGSRTRANLRKMEAGDPIGVYYDPLRPEEAALQPWVSSGWEFWVIFGLLWTTAAAAQLRWQIRMSRASE